MSHRIALSSTLLLAAALCVAPGSALAGTCGVLPFSAGDGVNEGAAANISALVSSELDIRGGFDLVIAAPAEDFEGGDCGASTSCIKEFGKANKHEAVVSGRVEASGDEYALTLKLHDGKTANVIREVSASVPQKALQLADAIPDVVIELATGKAPDADEDAVADEDSGPLFDDVDFDDLMDEAEEEVETPKKKRSRAAPRNPRYDDEDDRRDDDEGEDPFGIDELDALDMSAEQLEKERRDRARQAELERIRAEEERQRERERAEEEKRRRIAEEREREERERARREREERERIARIEAERRAEEERLERERQERDRQARLERERREREDRERQARADRERREREEREAQARADEERRDRERQARAGRERREREEREERMAARERDREPEPEVDDDDEVVLASALTLGPSSGILIGGGDDDEEDGDYGGIMISSGDDDEDYDDYEVEEDDEPREGMIIGDDDERENPNVRRRREAGIDRDEDEADDRYSRARDFNRSRTDEYEDDEDDDYDLDLVDEDEGDREDEDDEYEDRSYEERSYGSEPIASRDDAYLDDGRYEADSYSSRRGRTRTGSSVKKSDTGWGNRPWFSARVAGGYTNYYLHFAQYGVDLGVFPHPRVSVDLQADFWTLSIRECPDCEQQYRTLPSFYLGGSYRFTNLKIVQPYVGGDVGTIVYAVGTLTDEAGNVTRRPLMGAAFEVKGGADFMFTRHFGIGAGVKAGLAYAPKIKDNVHPDWNPLQFLINVRIAAVVQF